MSQPKTEAQIRAEIHAATQQRLRQGREQRASLDGRGSGPLPYGYRRVPWDSVEVDTYQAAVVAYIFDVARQGYRQWQIAEALNAQGHTTTNGSRWEPSMMQTILNHATLYTTGMREWGGIVGDQRWPIILNLAPGQSALPSPRRGAKTVTLAPVPGLSVAPPVTTAPVLPAVVHVPPFPSGSQPISVEPSTHMGIPDGADDRLP